MALRLLLPLLVALCCGLLPVEVSSGLVGGFSNADPSSQAVRDALNFAVVQHNKRTNNAFLSQVQEVVKAEQQVVSGMNYKFTVKMGMTPCRKSHPETECAIHSDPAKARPYVCKFEVYTQVWTGTINMRNHTCNHEL